MHLGRWARSGRAIDAGADREPARVTTAAASASNGPDPRGLRANWIQGQRRRSRAVVGPPQPSSRMIPAVTCSATRRRRSRATTSQSGLGNRRTVPIDSAMGLFAPIARPARPHGTAGPQIRIVCRNAERRPRSRPRASAARAATRGSPPAPRPSSRGVFVDATAGRPGLRLNRAGCPSLLSLCRYARAASATETGTINQRHRRCPAAQWNGDVQPSARRDALVGARSARRGASSGNGGRRGIAIEPRGCGAAVREAVCVRQAPPERLFTRTARHPIRVRMCATTPPGIGVVAPGPDGTLNVGAGC